jgi:hypothetical protein
MNCNKKHRKAKMMDGKMKKEKMGYMMGGEVKSTSSQPVYGSTIADAMPKAAAN